MFVEPWRNHRSSWMTERMWIDFVVTTGNPAARSKRIW